MCLNCDYAFASANGFCSELCQNEFEEQAEADKSEEESE